MEYTTTKCPHCGYRTRNSESGVPKVQLGQTLACCPMCDKPIIDPIYTEYEFMTEKEQKKWSTSHLTTVETVRGIIMLILGVIFFIIGIIFSVIVVALFMGGGLIWMGISRFIPLRKARELNIGEQAIYESLIRTSNAKYVELLKKSYGKKRVYKPLPKRSKIIDDYKKYSTEDIHKRFESEFLKLLNIIGDDDKKIDAKKAKSSSSFVNGSALVAGVMALPSVVVGVKQNKDLAKKNEVELEFSNTKSNKVEKKESCIEQQIYKSTNKNSDANMAQKSNEKHLENKTKDIKEKTDNLNKNKLLELKELFEDGLITEEEYNEKRKQILDKL